MVSWNKAVGDKVSVDEVVAVLETDKVSVDIRSTLSGTIAEFCVSEGASVQVGAVMFRVAEGATPAQAAPAPQPAAPAQPKTPAPAPVVAAAPAAPAKSPAAAPAKPAVPAKKAAAQIPAVVNGSLSRQDVRVPMSRMRLRIAQRLKEAQTVNAMLTTFNEIDMTNLIALRNQFKDEFAEKHGVKLGFMSAFVRASASALQAQPEVNGVIDGTDIVYRDYVDISVAVATPTGLVVPVLRNVHNMGFHDIEAAIGALGKKARDGQIAIEDMVGGNFTISNGGVYGSLMGTPIINPPQSAILGMHGIFKRPVAIGDKVEVRPMMYVALTYDHRIIDGQGAVTFLKRVKAAIEEPTRMLLAL